MGLVCVMRDQPRLSDGVAGECQRAMHHDFLAKRGRDDVESPPEWSEDIAVDQAADRIEPKSFRRARDTPPPITMRRGASKVIACVRANATAVRARSRIAEESGSPRECGLGDDGRGDLARGSVGLSSVRPSRLSPCWIFCRAEFLRGRRNRPARSHLLQFEHADSRERGCPAPAGAQSRSRPGRSPR